MENKKYEYEIDTIKRNTFMENESRKILNEIMPIIKEELSPYLNKKVLKVNGELLKEIRDNSILRTFKKKINPLIKGDYATISHLYIDTSPYSLSVKLSLCFNGGNYEDRTNYTYYWETYSYICNIDKNEIKDIKEYENKNMVNVDDEILVFKKAIKLKDELDLELSKFKLYKLKDLIK